MTDVTIIMSYTKNNVLMTCVIGKSGNLVRFCFTVLFMASSNSGVFNSKDGE